MRIFFCKGSGHQELHAGVEDEAYRYASMLLIHIDITRIAKSVRHLHASPLRFPDRVFQLGKAFTFSDARRKLNPRNLKP